MPNYAIYEDATNRVKEWVVSSPHDPTYPVLVGQTAIKDPDVTAVAGVPVMYWKHSGGAIMEMTSGEKSTLDAEISAQLVLDIRTYGKAILSGTTPAGIIQRAFAEIVKDEINILRQWDASLKTAFANNTTLANIRTAVAALPATGDRTLAQLKTAIENEIDSGGVDS